jgi:amino-acid N-acetyltransferase
VAIIRKAELHDVPKLFELINRYAHENVMLPRTLSDLYENVREFSVAEEGGRVLGCGALKFYNEELAEIRSLCVEPGKKAHGVGSALLKLLLDEADRYALKKVFALTLAPGFFEKCGFGETLREKIPLKIWRDCMHCEKLSRCEEKAVLLDLAARRELKTLKEAAFAGV